MLSKLLISLVLCLPAAIAGITEADHETVNFIVQLAHPERGGRLLIASDFNGVLVEKVKGTAVTAETMRPIYENYIEPLARRKNVDFYVVSSKPGSQLTKLLPNKYLGFSAEHNMESTRIGGKTFKPTTNVDSKVFQKFFGHLTNEIKIQTDWKLKAEPHQYSLSYTYPEETTVDEANKFLRDTIEHVRGIINEKSRHKFTHEFDIVNDRTKPQLMLASNLRGKGNLVQNQLNHGSYTFGISLGDKAADLGMHQAMHDRGFVGIIVGANLKTDTLQNNEIYRKCFFLSGPDAVHHLFEQLASPSKP